ncbi:hypothetical protein Amsp01_050000 [Amycolatopsis sp. NBRC 101858]|nr:hypothetical protein Amsp01_050000 [Amycolatopsis sp. NBRC 101858]
MEWVADHLEARGHLLVHGVTLAQVARRAVAALEAYPFAGARKVRLRILHAGWWRVESCHCVRSLACSNHPVWHYRPATASDAGAWRGAEVRLQF